MQPRGGGIQLASNAAPVQENINLNLCKGPPRQTLPVLCAGRAVRLDWPKRIPGCLYALARSPARHDKARRAHTRVQSYSTIQSAKKTSNKRTEQEKGPRPNTCDCCCRRERRGKDQSEHNSSSSPRDVFIHGLDGRTYTADVCSNVVNQERRLRKGMGGGVCAPDRPPARGQAARASGTRGWGTGGPGTPPSR